VFSFRLLFSGASSLDDALSNTELIAGPEFLKNQLNSTYYLDVWQCPDNHGKGIGEKMPGSVASRE